MEKPVYQKNMETTHKIEVLIKALGTMVMIPQYESDPNIIGSKKQYTGVIQTPILTGDQRTAIELTLLELVKEL